LDYEAYAPLLPGLGLAMGIGFLANVPAITLVARRRFRIAFLACVASCLTSALASSLLIPSHGISGAAWVMGISSLVHWIACALGLHVADWASGGRWRQRVSGGVGRYLASVGRPEARNVESAKQIAIFFASGFRYDPAACERSLPRHAW
jgi:O-antigen/teichoic acid export membrane protein